MISLGTTGLLTLTTHRLESAAAGPHFAAASADDTRSTEKEGAVLWAANVLACGQLLAWFRGMLGPAVWLSEGYKIMISRITGGPIIARSWACTAVPMTKPPGSPYGLWLPLIERTERHKSCAIHRLCAMTTLPSLIIAPGEQRLSGRQPCPRLRRFHFGVVSSSQAQPPASMASMLLNRTLPAGSL